MIKVYRKTGTIKAEQFDGSKEVAKRYGAELYSDSGYGYDAVEGEPDGDGYVLITPEGELLLRTNDWIVTGANGEHWPIAEDVIKKMYAELPVIPKDVAYIIKQARNGGYKLGWVFHAAYSGIWQVSVGNWIRAYAETFARAWLDGYVVEE